MAANPSRHHACPRPLRRFIGGRNLLLRESNCFLAGAAWNDFKCYACCLLAAGRQQWVVLVARGLMGLLHWRM